MRKPRTSSHRIGLLTGLASCALSIGLACSSSEAPKGGSIIEGPCDPAVDSSCGEVGDSCGASGECASGSCASGQCVLVSEPGGTPTGGAGGSFGDTFFVDDLDMGQGGSPIVEPSCVDLDVDFERVTPTVVLLIDRSGSMDQSFENGVDRWDTLVNTLTDPQNSLIKKLEGSVRFGMALYTSNGGFGSGPTPLQCPVLTQVGIALDNFSAMSSVLSVTANGPAGDTPTAESMAAVAAQLQAFGEEGPKSIILATDGDPDTCEDPDANDSEASKVRSVAAVTEAYTGGITTHIISVGNEVTATHLKALAVAGRGGDSAAEAYTALDTNALVEAFNSIIGSVRTCDFTLEGTVKAKDASRGSVVLDGQTLGFEDANGWEMPDEQTVRLLGAACETVEADASGISMRFPCDAIQIIPR
jgi:hypothetical protein